MRRGKGGQQAHGLAAVRTERSRRGRRGGRDGRAQLHGPTGVQLHAQTAGLGGGMTEAVVTDRAQPARQDMSQIAPDKLHARKERGFDAVAGVAILPAEGNGLLGDRPDAGVADGGAGDVSAQILQSGDAGARGLDMHAPLLAPGRWVDLPAVNLKEVAQVLAEGGLQVRQVNEEVGLFDADQPAAVIETGARNQAMNVRMKAHLLVPGVEHGGKAVDRGPQSLVRGQLLRESVGDGGEEQIIGLFGEGPEEAAAQLGRQGEGDQEIGGVDQLGQLALNPAGRGGTAALRAGLVIAGVPGEMDLAAVQATLGPPAQGRRAAMGDGPQGAALLGRKRRSRFQEIRHKQTQRPQHRGGNEHEVLRQVAAQLVHQAQRIAGRLMGDVQVDHGGSDLFMAEKFLDGVQMSAGFQEVSGEAVAQRMGSRGGDVELLAGQDEQTLQRGVRHGRGGLAHALGQDFEVVVAAADVGKEEQRVPVKLPVALQFLPQAGGQRHDAILMFIESFP